jgi:hypothetical protein
MDRVAVSNAHRRNVGWVEGANNQNPWGPRQGISHSAYCDSAQSVVAYDCGYRWWPESQCGQLGCAYCPSHVSVGSAHGEVVFDHASRGAPADIQEGDLLFYDWNGTGVADHVEYALESVGVAPKTHDIGYNTGSPNGCHDLWRDRRYLLCRLRPTHYGDGSQPGQPGTGTTPAPTPAPTPVPSPEEDDMIRLFQHTGGKYDPANKGAWYIGVLGAWYNHVPSGGVLGVLQREHVPYNNVDNTSVIQPDVFDSMVDLGSLATK